MIPYSTSQLLVIIFLLVMVQQVCSGTSCSLKPTNGYSIHYDGWLNLTYTYRGCIAKIYLYTPNYEDGPLRPVNTRLSKDLVINRGNDTPLPGCSNNDTWNVSIDVRITENSDKILDGVIAVKGQRAHDDDCSCTSLPIRYRVNETDLETVLETRPATSVTSSTTTTKAPGQHCADKVSGSTQSIAKYSPLNIFASVLVALLLYSVLSML